MASVLLKKNQNHVANAAVAVVADVAMAAAVADVVPSLAVVVDVDLVANPVEVPVVNPVEILVSQRLLPRVNHQVKPLRVKSAANGRVIARLRFNLFGLG